jgi:hypothetical protein
LVGQENNGKRKQQTAKREEETKEGKIIKNSGGFRSEPSAVFLFNYTWGGVTAGGVTGFLVL